jgi:hypothetical protein
MRNADFDFEIFKSQNEFWILILNLKFKFIFSLRISLIELYKKQNEKGDSQPIHIPEEQHKNIT